MGNTIDRLAGYDEDQISEPTSGSDSGSTPKSGKKRKRSDDESGFSPSKKVTKLDTAKYVYEKLFLQGEGSDVTIHAIGRVWNLHKLYLQQCKYFEVLLNGDWKDSKNNIFHLEFPDDNITIEGINSTNIINIYLTYLRIIFI
uniref:BTB domain-containing protein n=1 Tax=Heterorhabditis bacteriophora TaxID=37862 RepID=A0A1I7XRL0_HETBA